MECKRPSRKSKGVARTGTTAGYKAHKRAKEPVCPDCQRAQTEASRKSHEANRERNNERSRQYHYRNREKENRRRNALYYEKKEEFLRKARLYYDENSHKVRSRTSEYKRERPGQYRMYNLKRQGAAQRSHVRWTKSEVAERWGTTCYLCGHEVDRDVGQGYPESPEIDHVVPLSRGGADEISNLRWTHARCNRWKGSRMVGELTLHFEEPKIRQILELG